MVENYSKIISHIFAKSSILASESGSNIYENASSGSIFLKMLHPDPNLVENDASLSRLYNVNVVKEP
jgi:hypothetical protein